MVDGRLVAAVERKSLADLVSSLINGKLRYALGDLAALPRAAVVVEDRYSAVFKLDVRPAVIADGLAEFQVRWPSVPIVFAETRPLAEEWTYRYLAAAGTGPPPNSPPRPNRDDRPAPPGRPGTRRSRPSPKSAPGPATPGSTSPTEADSAPTSGTPGAPPTENPCIPGTACGQE